MFEVGEIINPEDWGLRLQITSLAPLEGTIVKNNAPASYVGKFFPIGKILRFTPAPRTSRRRRRYRLVPGNHARGYTIYLSVRYDGQWQPWIEVDHFGVDDILCDKWQVS